MLKLTYGVLNFYSASLFMVKGHHYDSVCFTPCFHVGFNVTYPSWGKVASRALMHVHNAIRKSVHWCQKESCTMGSFWSPWCCFAVEFCSREDASDNVSEFIGWSEPVVQRTVSA